MMRSEQQSRFDPAALREHLRHVYWTGGGSGAGKSSVARRLAAEHDLRLYSTDEAMAEHSRRSTPEDCPRLREFMAMDMNERWLNRSPTAMLETFHWFRGEGFSMITDDLLHLPANRKVIVEGFRLLPRLVKPLLSNARQAVWLLPTPEFREAAIQQRGGGASGFLAKTSNPQKALRNLLERDRMFTDRLTKEVEGLELPAFAVHTGMSEEDSASLVEKLFGL
jgi:hypothetical protein